MLILKFHIPLPVHAQLKQPQKSVASVTAANEAIKYQQDFKGLAMRECYKGERKLRGVGERERGNTKQQAKQEIQKKLPHEAKNKRRHCNEKQGEGRTTKCVCGDV